MNAKPSVPVTLRVLVITGGGGAIVIVTFAVPVPPRFDALTPTVKVPEVVGVPEIRPLPALNPRPDGNPLAPQLVGLLLAVI